MQALNLDKTLGYRTDVSRPDPAADQALIRLSLAGICATDLELLNGYAGFSGIPGHEFVGRVEAVGDQSHRHWLGRRVVGSINIGCNRCEICRLHGPEHCPERKVLGIRGWPGAFADFLALPVRNLHAVPDQIPDEAAVFTEPLAAALRVLEQLRGRAVSAVAVAGPGRLGLLIAKVLAVAGFEVLVLGRSASSLELPRHWRLRSALIQDQPGNGFDCVVDATGHADGFAQALRLVKPRGCLLLKSSFAANAPVDFSKVVVGEITIAGSRCGPFPEALALLMQGDVPVETMIDGRYSLKDGLAAFAHAARPGVRKILLSP